MATRRAATSTVLPLNAVRPAAPRAQARALSSAAASPAPAVPRSSGAPRRPNAPQRSLKRAQPIACAAIGASAASRGMATAAAPAETTEARRPLLSKVLVANRGEIAVRVISTLKRLGVKSVAVFSDADRDGMWVKMADEAYGLGGMAAAESYLKADRIVEIAKMCGAQGIHPGYGFLSENADFADLVESHGIAFIGPRGHSIRDMGSKSESKVLMLGANVPCVPGYHGSNQEPAFLLEESRKIGFPVLIKAVKGGGGKGMRIAASESEFMEQLDSARREAERSFGDGRVLVEKYIGRPRHVEVQVFADGMGGVVHFYERDCSVQRRHQKIIEEAPAPALPAALRTRLAHSAIAAARAVNYRGAGTVEFILDASTLHLPEPLYYFMEMNTRLQVEHPVTEMVSGVDLVEWQVDVASGNPLPAQWLATNSDQPTAERPPNGHAFETRIYAEDPDNNFFPAPGPLLHLRFPDPIPGVLRVETGVKEGDEVGVLYDPMIAKLVTWGRDRPEALRRMREALEKTEIVGPGTNIEFLKRLCVDERFIAADVDTAFIPSRKEALFPPIPNGGRPSEEAIAVAALGYLKAAGGIAEKKTPDPWAAFSGFQINGAGVFRMDVSWEGEKVGDKAPVVLGQVEVTYLPKDRYKIVLREKVEKKEGKVLLEITEVHLLASSVSNRSVKAGNETASVGLLWNLSTPSTVSQSTLRSTNVVVTRDIKGEREGGISVFGSRGLEVVGLPVPEYLKQTHKMEAQGSVKTPMPCRIISVLVKPGDLVEKGQPLIVLEAMKMEHVIKSPDNGKIAKINYKVGDTVGEGRTLLELEGDAEEVKKPDEE